jgi:hypothetical protein
VYNSVKFCRSTTRKLLLLLVSLVFGVSGKCFLSQLFGLLGEEADSV